MKFCDYENLYNFSKTYEEAKEVKQKQVFCATASEFIKYMNTKTKYKILRL